MKKFDEINVKNNGKVYTPDYIVKNILDLSGYKGKNILKKHVIDNSCGDGAFLAEIVSRYCKQCRLEKLNTKKMFEQLSFYIHGIEIDRSEVEKCKNRLDLIVKDYGIEKVKWDVVCADTLKCNRFYNMMDFVLGNPPYVRVHNLGDLYKGAKKFSFAKKGMTDLYIVFFEIGLKMLNKDGVLGYITPSSWFNSVAGGSVRECLLKYNLLEKIVDLKHHQAFSATTYSAITVLSRKKKSKNIKYFEYDAGSKTPIFIDTLNFEDVLIDNKFYFSNTCNIVWLKKIITSEKQTPSKVKNGYATLSDNIFLHEASNLGEFVIPVVKSSTGELRRIIFPYNKNGELVKESELMMNSNVFKYLVKNKNELLKHGYNEKKNGRWYAYGRSQAIKDTYKNKVSINSLVRSKEDIKLCDAPPGVGVYGGLYIVDFGDRKCAIKKALISNDFIRYVKLLGKYKSGGYYTFSSGDLKKFLNYKIGRR